MLFLIQLFFGTLIFLGVFGLLSKILRNLLNPDRYSLSLILIALITILVYCLIAYYFSEAYTIYASENNSGLLLLIFSFIVLFFLLYSPSKYGSLVEEKGIISLAATISGLFFITLRLLPNVGNFLFDWVPIHIWT